MTARIPIALLAAVAVAAGAARAGEEPSSLENLTPLPIPRPLPGVRFYSVYDGDARYGVEMVQPPVPVSASRELSPRTAAPGAKHRIVTERVRFRYYAELELGVPVDTSVREVVFTDPRSGGLLGFTVVRRRTLAPGYVPPSGATFDERELQIEAFVAPERGQTVLRMRMSSRGKLLRDETLPWSGGERVSTDLSFLHAAYKKTIQGTGGGGTKQPDGWVEFKVLVPENLVRLSVRARRAGRREIRLRDGTRVDAVEYEVETRPVTKGKKAPPAPPTRQRMFFRRADGWCVRTAADQGGHEGRVVELGEVVAPRALERRRTPLDWATPRELPFASGETVEYRLYAGNRELGRLSLRMFRETEGRSRLRVWSDLVLRPDETSGRDEETRTWYDARYAPVRFAAEGVVRALPDDLAQAEPAVAQGPAPKADRGEVQTHPYRRNAAFLGDHVHASVDVDGRRRERKLAATGPLLLVDYNLVHPWVLVAAALPREPGRTLRMAAYHVRRMELGFIHFTVGPETHGRGGKRMPVHVVSPQFKMMGHMVIDERGRLLKFLQVYPGGKIVELRLMQP